MWEKTIIKDINSYRKLYEKTKIPILGFGLYNLKDKEEFEFSVNTAINAGYRHFDTASFYGNENLLGKTIKKNGLNRNEVFITTKLWKTDFGYENTFIAFNKSLQNLEMDYVDLYLVHLPQKETLAETWCAIEEIYNSGKAKAIGVSNFSVEDLTFLIKDCKIIPMVNQIEHHPYFPQKEIVDYCFRKKIQIVAHSPLMWGGVINEEKLKNFSLKYNKTVPQIVLRWNLQKNIVVIPKSSNKSRIEENADIFNFQITVDDMKELNELNENRKIGGTTLFL